MAAVNQKISIRIVAGHGEATQIAAQIVAAIDGLGATVNSKVEITVLAMSEGRREFERALGVAVEGLVRENMANG